MAAIDTLPLTHLLALPACAQATGDLRSVLPLPGIGSVAGFSGRREDSDAFFKFTSFTEPGAIYRCCGWRTYAACSSAFRMSAADCARLGHASDQGTPARTRLASAAMLSAMLQQVFCILCSGTLSTPACHGANTSTSTARSSLDRTLDALHRLK